MSGSIRRRDFIHIFGSAAAAWPLAARAQQPGLPVIGYLDSSTADPYKHAVAAFRQGLAETGYVEGRNVTIEFVWADNNYERLPALAAGLVGRQVAVLVASGTSVAIVAKAATSTIPVVFSMGGDPVKLGLVASLARPGGNLTGIYSLNSELLAKRLELIREAVPAAKLVGLLVNPFGQTVSEPLAISLQTSAEILGFRLLVLQASNEREIDEAFAALAAQRAGGLIVASDVFFIGQSERLAALGLQHKLPIINQYREFAAAGGLMSYGGSQTEAYRFVGNYTARILKGAKPSDLPVQQHSRIGLIINLKTAAALGLTLPTALLARADEVIE